MPTRPVLSSIASAIGCGVALVTMLATLQAPAAAAETPKWRLTARSASAQHREGKYEAALRSYREALALARKEKNVPFKGVGDLLYMIAQCHRKLTHRAKAVTFLKAYLRHYSAKNKAPHDAGRVRRDIKDLEREIAKTRAGSPPSTLKSTRATKAAQPPVKAPESRSAPVSDSSDALAARRTKSIWGYTLLGTGAALVAVAAVLYGVGLSQRSSAHEDYLAAREQTDLDRHWSDVESAQAKITAGHVLVGVGAAAAAIGLYQLLTRPSPVRSAWSAPLRVAVLPGAVTIGGRF